jgi:hypothetical protein
MANNFQPVSVQSVVVEGITGPNGADRMHVTAGTIQVWGGQGTGQTPWTGLLEPQLEPGQFRRAIATVSMMSTALSATNTAARVLDVEADWDDESGKVELRFSTQGEVSILAFQVMTFAAPPS